VIEGKKKNLKEKPGGEWGGFEKGNLQGNRYPWTGRRDDLNFKGGGARTRPGRKKRSTRILKKGDIMANLTKKESIWWRRGIKKEEESNVVGEGGEKEGKEITTGGGI